MQEDAARPAQGTFPPARPRPPDSATHSPTPLRSFGRAAGSMQRCSASSAAVRSFTAPTTSTRYFMRCGVLSSPDCRGSQGPGSAAESMGQAELAGPEGDVGSPSMRGGDALWRPP